VRWIPAAASFARCPQPVSRAVPRWSTAISTRTFHSRSWRSTLNTIRISCWSQTPAILKGDFGLERGEARASAAKLFTFGSIAVYRSAFFADCQDGVFPIMPLWQRSMAAGLCSAQLYSGSGKTSARPRGLPR